MKGVSMYRADLLFSKKESFLTFFERFSFIFAFFLMFLSVFRSIFGPLLTEFHGGTHA